MLTVPEILRDLGGISFRHVVLTGGEPMLFDPIVDLACGLQKDGYTITIETAGTVFRDLPCDLMSISPKLANSTPPADSGWQERHEATRLDRSPLARLMETYECQLKFVINPDVPGDLEEIDELLATLPKIADDRILLMAEGIDSETLNRRMKALVPICLERNWRLTPRLHVDLFGNTRGT